MTMTPINTTAVQKSEDTKAGPQSQVHPEAPSWRRQVLMLPALGNKIVPRDDHPSQAPGVGCVWMLRSRGSYCVFKRRTLMFCDSD